MAVKFFLLDVNKLLGKNRWVVNGRINPGPDSHGAGLYRAGESLCSIIVDMLEHQLGIDQGYLDNGIVSNNYQKPNNDSNQIPISAIDSNNQIWQWRLHNESKKLMVAQKIQ